MLGSSDDVFVVIEVVGRWQSRDGAETVLIGKSPRNRDHEAHCSITLCSSLERRPRFLGGCQRGGGT